MKLIIDNSKRISDVQKQFNSIFPYLKIQLFKKPHLNSQGSPKNEMINESILLSQLNHTDGNIEIDGEMTVQELESLFNNLFNLNIQVFRKSGKSWLETTITDNWTLNKQNEEGEELSKMYN
jgi:hypothetical protein